MFGKRKHRTFNYKPRLSKENQSGALDEDSKARDLIYKWKNESHRPSKIILGTMPIKILILVLLLICMYLLERKYM